jgi:hypothetical protein
MGDAVSAEAAKVKIMQRAIAKEKIRIKCFIISYLLSFMNGFAARLFPGYGHIITGEPKRNLKNKKIFAAILYSPHANCSLPEKVPRF